MTLKDRLNLLLIVKRCRELSIQTIDELVIMKYSYSIKIIFSIQKALMNII